MTDTVVTAEQAFGERLNTACALREYRDRGRPVDLHANLVDQTTCEATYPTVYTWIKGKQIPSRTDTLALATLLRVDAKWLHTGEGDMIAYDPDTNRAWCAEDPGRPARSRAKPATDVEAVPAAAPETPQSVAPESAAPVAPDPATPALTVSPPTAPTAPPRLRYAEHWNKLHSTRAVNAQALVDRNFHGDCDQFNATFGAFAERQGLALPAGFHAPFTPGEDFPEEVAVAVERFLHMYRGWLDQDHSAPAVEAAPAEPAPAATAAPAGERQPDSQPVLVIQHAFADWKPAPLLTRQNLIDLAHGVFAVKDLLDGTVEHEHFVPLRRADVVSGETHIAVRIEDDSMFSATAPRNFLPRGSIVIVEVSTFDESEAPAEGQIVLAHQRDSGLFIVRQYAADKFRPLSPTYDTYTWEDTEPFGVVIQCIQDIES